jgi:hypothetical protein
MQTTHFVTNHIEYAVYVVPELKTYALPQGLQVQRGSKALKEYLREKLAGIIRESNWKESSRNFQP